MLIFALIMVGVIPVFAKAITITAKAASITTATRVANDAMEYARSVASKRNVAGDPDSAGGTKTCEEFVAAFSDPTSPWKVNDTHQYGHAKVSVKLVLPDCSSKPRAVPFTVIVSQRGKTLADMTTELWLQ